MHVVRVLKLHRNGAPTRAEGDLLKDLGQVVITFKDGEISALFTLLGGPSEEAI